jgi:DNA-binding PadR family transcriptional regulator
MEKDKEFWQGWQEEQKRLGETHNGWENRQPGPHFPGPELARAWRTYFRDFMGVWPEAHWVLGSRRFKPWHQGVDTFNPFVAGLLSKGGGLLPLYVLQLLAERPYYANELMSLIAERTGRQWLANPGAIYPLMNQLEQQDLVAGEWEDPHKRTVRIYQLTEAGQQELARLRSIVRPRLQEAIEILGDLHDDLGGEAAVSQPERFDGSSQID